MKSKAEPSHNCLTEVCDHPPMEGWRRRGNCSKLRDPDVMFPDDEINDKIAVMVAKSICTECPMRGYCLEYGWFDEYGIWGGYSTPDRARLRKWLRLPSRGIPPRRLARTLAQINGFGV